MLFKKLSIALVVFTSFLYSTCHVYALEVILGGQSIGIQLEYDGVMITGTYDISIDNKTYNPASDGFQAGDLITHVNGSQVSSISLLMSNVEKEIGKNNDITLTIFKNNKSINKTLKYQMAQDKFSTGLYVQEKLMGVGTLTYYNPNQQTYGALGHVLIDNKLANVEALEQGSVYNSYVKRIQASSNGNPGEKVADIGTIKFGTVYKNNNFGLYGKYDSLLSQNVTYINTATQDEVTTGDAYFLTVLEGQTVQKVNIKITKLKKQATAETKGITFEIIDKEVLALTNGVIQGMSGSPIIQNGKLVGAVTHVDVNNVKQGYGLYIDWMLENDN